MALYSDGEVMEIPWWVYILECADGTLYTGATPNVRSRLIKHNKGKASKYTRSRLPVKVVWRQEHPNKSIAMKREAAIKKLTRKQKEDMIAGKYAECH